MIQIPLWIYAALMAASTGANMMAQKKVANERAKAMEEERVRREKLSKENEASAERTKNLFADVQKDQDTRAAELAQKIAPTAHEISTGPAGSRLLDPASPPSATQSVAEASQAFGDSNAKGAAFAQALGKAGSFGSVFGDYSRAAATNAQDIDINSTSMRNWNQNVLPARLEYANGTGREWGTTADVLKLAATIMGPMALGGGGGAANAATRGVSDAGAQIAGARWGDLAAGFGAGGSVPFGSMAGIGGTGFAGLVADTSAQELQRKVLEYGIQSLSELELAKYMQNERYPQVGMR